MAQQSAKSRYMLLKAKRDPFLRRARDSAAFTIPALMPPEGHNEYASLPEPYQGLGARCVVNLASRLMVAMYPPGKPSFKLDVPAEQKIQSGQITLGNDVETGLVLSEKLINAEIERKQWRMPTNLALQYLIVTGNALEYMTPENKMRVYRLDQYVVVRDMEGSVKELMIEEFLSPLSLPEKARSLIKADDVSTQRMPIYTHVKREKDGTFSVYQEINDKKVPGSDGVYTVLPYNALRYTAVIGEDYGRGKVEEHLPDFRAVDGLAKSLLDSAAMASRNIVMIRPNASGGLNLRRRISSANNGDVVVGNHEDINMLQFTNTSGIQVAAAEMERLTKDIAGAFLLSSAAIRDSERTTATEVRRVSEELEGVLGGVYSQLTQEMQLPRLRRLIFQMQRAKQLPAWPENMIEPTILTGLEALGREQDVNRVAQALQFIAQLPPQVLDYIKFDSLLNKAFNGLDLSDSVRPEAEVQQARAQAQQQEQQNGLLQTVAPEVIKQQAKAQAPQAPQGN